MNSYWIVRMNFESFVASFAAAFALVFLSEIGDKTQLALVAFTAEHPTHAKHAWLGASFAFALLSILALAVGKGISTIVPAFWVTVVSSALFLAFGIQALLKSHKNEATNKKGALKEDQSAFWAAFAFIAVSEMGDKSQIVTLTLGATTLGWVAGAGVWAGAWLSMTILAGLGVLIGKHAAQHVPARLLHRAAGALFLLAAAWPWIP